LILKNTPSDSVMDGRLLSKGEMTDHLAALLEKNPLMPHQADQLGCCRGCLLWIRFLFDDAEHHARSIAMTVAALTRYRAFFQGYPLEDFDFLDYQDYKMWWNPEPKIVKIWKLAAPNGHSVDEGMQNQIDRKYGEIQSAIAWLEGLQGGHASRLGFAFGGAHTALVDALTCLDYYKRAKFVDGKPVVEAK
jgi:hypothetical protein